MLPAPPKLMFVLVDPRIPSTATMSEVRGYGHTHLIYVAEQWDRENRPDISLRGYEGDICMACLSVRMSEQFLSAMLDT